VDLLQRAVQLSVRPSDSCCAPPAVEVRTRMLRIFLQQDRRLQRGRASSLGRHLSFHPRFILGLCDQPNVTGPPKRGRVGHGSSENDVAELEKFLREEFPQASATVNHHRKRRRRDLPAAAAL